VHRAQALSWIDGQIVCFRRVEKALFGGYRRSLFAVLANLGVQQALKRQS
jgi:hypothetical protein